MNILTFDIEEWYIEKSFGVGNNEKYSLFDNMLNIILHILNEINCKATFFCLGKIAKDFPEVVKKISNNGHEIGCHSNEHMWLNQLTPGQLKNDTQDAIKALQDVSGQKVESYRAPAFSIGKTNSWALEVLAEAGIKNDASIFPAARDFGGFDDFPCDRPCVIEYNGVRLNEYPMPVVDIMGKKIVYSGGGYFRLLPLWFVKKQMNKSNYNMCYFHIMDFLKDKSPLMSRAEFESYFKENGSLKNRFVRYFKANVGRSNALSRLETLLSDFNFTSINEYVSNNTITHLVRL